MRSTVKDQRGHHIYLTDERWHHICDEHPEMQGYRRQTLETIRKGQRFQDSVRPQGYLYYRNYQRLTYSNTTIVVVVYFGFSPDGRENNFIMTAYQIRRQKG